MKSTNFYSYFHDDNVITILRDVVCHYLSFSKSKNGMRESDSETEIKGWLRHCRKQAYRRSLSPNVRSHRDGRGSGWVPPYGEDGDDWHVVSPRRRKARRQAMRRHEWMSGEQRFWERSPTARRQSRPRLSWQVFDGSDVDYYQARKSDRYREELAGGSAYREGLNLMREARKPSVGWQVAAKRRQRAVAGGGGRIRLCVTPRFPKWRNNNNNHNNQSYSTSNGALHYFSNLFK